MVEELGYDNTDNEQDDVANRFMFSHEEVLELEASNTSDQYAGSCC